MKNNIIKNVLFSVALHGIALACCFAVPAQKLVPLFQAGNSAFTLTALSISMPDKELPPDESDLGNEAEDETGDFPVIPAKKPSATAAPKHQKRPAPMDADARTKGVFSGLSESAGIRPYYPLGARVRGEEGIVKVEVCVGMDGHVLDCAVAKSSGYPALDDAALTAVKQARFVSAKSLPIKHESRTILTFRFDLVD